MYGSINKSPIKLNMQRKLNWHGDFFWMGKTYTAKTLPDDFKVTTPENPQLSKQAITSKGISIPYIDLQSNPSTWLINCADPNTRLHHQLEKDVGCKVLLFITRWRTWSCLVTKPYSLQTQQLLQEKEELGQTRFPITLFFTLV